MSADPRICALQKESSRKGQFFWQPISVKALTFSENVFHRFEGGKIEEVWSVIDTAAIAAQL
ncbi:ester cyclase [Agrobacterium rosae]|uniref:ester cyclase n=1 Tax=Agrobacterium rosae TaxID=1972867 RepID=UPI0009F8FF7B|nr:ester cyclase [Agrobacterium rosae]